MPDTNFKRKMMGRSKSQDFIDLPAFYPPPWSSPEDKKGYNTKDEYFQALEKWLHEAYMWQNVTLIFPHYLMCNQFLNRPCVNGNLNPQQTAFPSYLPVPLSSPNNSTAQNTTDEGIECKIPPIWKRLAAEFLDFLILFFLKLAVTFVAVDFFDIIDLDKLDFNILQKDLKLDYKMAIQMTHDFMLLELVHRVVVCAFETFWLQRGVAGRIGGATPGKAMLGLRVVRCESVSPLRAGSETLLIRPGTNLGLGWAFTRSFVKNLVLAFFIPANFAFFYFRHNRAGYDMICNTIVVEEPIIRHRPHVN